MSAPRGGAPVVVGLGEALFDVLPGGELLGGAPVNFAVHARQLLDRHGPPGVRAAVATRVGDDHLGHRLRGDLEARGLDTTAVQVDSARRTGSATVSLEAGHPVFTITPDVAWDHCAGDAAWMRLAREATAVCYGTLGSRSATSARAIADFLEAARGAIRLYDVNLRDPFHSPGLIRRLAGLATMLKANEKELPVVAEALGVPTARRQELPVRILEAANVDVVVLTLGAAGATIVTPQGSWTSPAREFPTAPNADTVGAGDAFCAAVIVGRLLGWPVDRTLDIACETAGYVASQPGATPTLPG